MPETPCSGMSWSFRGDVCCCVYKDNIFPISSLQQCPSSFLSSQFRFIPKKCWAKCPLPLTCLTQTQVPGLVPLINSKDALCFRGCTILVAPEPSLRHSLPDPHPATLDLPSQEAQPPVLRACMRLCVCVPDPLLGRDQAPFPRRLVGFRSLGCNQENGVSEISVGWILQVWRAVRCAHSRNTTLLGARWLHQRRGGYLR